MPISYTSELETWLTTNGVGENATAISPVATAREAAAPVSNARTATSTPCFLKNPCCSATSAIVPPKMGGMPGIAKVNFCCAEAIPGKHASAEMAHAASAVRIGVKRSCFVIFMLVPPRCEITPLLRHFELGLACVGHQRLPYVFAQFREARMLQRRPIARARQLHVDDLVHCARRALEHQHPVAHQHRFVDRVRDEHHTGRSRLPDRQELELQN